VGENRAWVVKFNNANINGCHYLYYGVVLQFSSPLAGCSGESLGLCPPNTLSSEFPLGGIALELHPDRRTKWSKVSLSCGNENVAEPSRCRLMVNVVIISSLRPSGHHGMYIAVESEQHQHCPGSDDDRQCVVRIDDPPRHQPCLSLIRSPHSESKLPC
jgi:hypothetical protein